MVQAGILLPLWPEEVAVEITEEELVPNVVVKITEHEDKRRTWQARFTQAADPDRRTLTNDDYFDNAPDVLRLVEMKKARALERREEKKTAAGTPMKSTANAKKRKRDAEHDENQLAVEELLEELGPVGDEDDGEEDEEEDGDE